jgi:hypothetical protein
MDSNDLALLLRDCRETVPVSRPAKFLPAALALRGFSKREPGREHQVITLTGRQGGTPLLGEIRT